jgi:small subunit ribosomal protein S2
MEEDGTMDKLPGKEAAAIKRQMARMSRNFEGLLDMNELPGALFVIDSKTEAIAVAEANRLEIPVCALVDSNSDPTLIDYPIPGNDDSSKSIRIVADVIMEAIQSGSANRVVVKVQKGITPVVQDDFDDGDDEPEVNLPEGYEEFVDTRRRDDDSQETEKSTENAPAEVAPAAEEKATAEDEVPEADDSEETEKSTEDAPEEVAPAAEEKATAEDEVPEADDSEDEEVAAETDQEELKEQEAEAGEETPEEEDASNDDSDSASEEKPEN